MAKPNHTFAIVVEEFLKQTRVESCGMRECVHNKEADCNLKEIYISPSGLCANQRDNPLVDKR